MFKRWRLKIGGSKGLHASFVIYLISGKNFFASRKMNDDKKDVVDE